MTDIEIKTLFFELCDAQRFDYEVEYVAGLLDSLEANYPGLLDEYREREARRAKRKPQTEPNQN